MSRAPLDQALWQPWIEHVCAAVDVDPALVDVSAIHALTGQVAATFARPMAPVSAHLYGLALGAGMSPEAAVSAIRVAAVKAGETGGVVLATGRADAAAGRMTRPDATAGPGAESSDDGAGAPP